MVVSLWFKRESEREPCVILNSDWLNLYMYHLLENIAQMLRNKSNNNSFALVYYYVCRISHSILLNLNIQHSTLLSQYDYGCCS